MAVEQALMMNDSAYPDISNRSRSPTIVPLALSKVPSVPIEPINTQGFDVGFSIEFQMEEQKEVPKMST